jgi:hypothetical protein
MTASTLELADIVRRYGPDFNSRFGRMMSRQQWRVLRAITSCRTAELGGRKYRCDDCKKECYIYNPCRNRHCPKCQAKARADWTEAREAELLPIPYFHVIFTLPQELALLALQNKRVVYKILFRSASRTLQILAADPKHLGAKIGILAVLHTWGQTLAAHPHLHCVVTGGGISPDGQQWIPCKVSKRSKKEFFVHVDVLSSFFRKRFIRSLKRAYRTGELRFRGKTAHLADPDEFERWINSLPKKWNVYAKRPFRRTKKLLRYLARYTHRVAISNQRLLSMEDGHVEFSYKDYNDGDKQKTMRLSAVKFISRFLMHVLPSGFMRIRYYGFLANRCRKEQLELCRRLLGVSSSPSDALEPLHEDAECHDHEQPIRCPACKTGKLSLLYEIPSPWASRPVSPVSRGSPSDHASPLQVAV